MSTISTSKEELQQAIIDIFNKLMVDYDSIPEEWAKKVGVEGNIKGTEITISDTVAYLVGWGNLVLKWQTLSENNEKIDFPETGFKWSGLGLLAQHFHRQYDNVPYRDLLNELDNTVTKILQLISRLDNGVLYGEPWYENYTLGRMIQLNTSAPMKNMRTKVRRFKKQNNIR
ncbi:ClbS/DfsB family four-helix bundle protein [Vibrio sp. WXL210]|uniref:ClbS/DfsB family four-helix bundle protein n=1 Tax=Vibrio sp. WXL210 TaxID=3450709 RepID=UPI003EC6D8C9